MSFIFAGQYTEALIARGASSGNTAFALPTMAVNVYQVGTTTPVTLYTSRTKAVGAANPVSTDADGNLTFFTNPGQVDLVFTPAGGAAKRVTVMVPQDPAEDPGTYATIVETPPTPERHGAVGNGVADDTAALTAFFAAGYSAGSLRRGSTYLTSTTQTMPVAMKALDATGATVKASGVIAGPILTVGSLTSQRSNGRVTGGIWECNAAARNGIYAPWSLNERLDEVIVRNPTQHGIILGDVAASGGSAEHKLIGVKVDRDFGATVPATFYGIWTQNSTDGEIISTTVNGADTCFRNDKPGNRYIGCHGWGWTGHVPSVIFDDNGGNTDFISCEVDTPSLYGFLLRQWNWRIIGGFSIMAAEPGLDNVATAIHTTTTPSGALISGHYFQGSASRWAKDYDGPVPDPGITVLNCGSGGNVVTAVLTAGKNFFGGLETYNGIRVQAKSGGATIYSGTGSPNTFVNATAGDHFWRTDTPGTVNQRLYICTGGTAWTGIL